MHILLISTQENQDTSIYGYVQISTEFISAWLPCPKRWKRENVKLFIVEDIFKRYFESRRRNRILNVSYRIKILLSHIRSVDQARAFTIFFGKEKQTLALSGIEISRTRQFFVYYDVSIHQFSAQLRLTLKTTASWTRCTVAIAFINFHSLLYTQSWVNWDAISKNSFFVDHVVSRNSPESLIRLCY